MELCQKISGRFGLGRGNVKLSLIRTNHPGNDNADGSTNRIHIDKRFDQVEPIDTVCQVIDTFADVGGQNLPTVVSLVATRALPATPAAVFGRATAQGWYRVSPTR